MGVDIMQSYEEYTSDYNFKIQCYDAAHARADEKFTRVVVLLNDFVHYSDWQRWFVAVLPELPMVDPTKDVFDAAAKTIQRQRSWALSCVECCFALATARLLRHTATPLPDGAEDDLNEIKRRGSADYAPEEIDALYDKYLGSYKMAATLLDLFGVGPGGMMPGRDFEHVNIYALRNQLNQLCGKVLRFLENYDGDLSPDDRDLLEGAEIYDIARRLDAFTLRSDNNPAAVG